MSKYKILKHKVLSKGYYQSRLDLFMQREKYWNDFETFKCNDFFVGYASAEVNRELYNKNIFRVRAKVRWYAKKVMEE